MTGKGMAELMKGKVWGEYAAKVKYPVAVEIKHDEIRCRAVVGTDYTVTYTSYAGKPLYNMEGADALLGELAARFAVFEFDLGIEVNDNFNDSYRWVRSSRGAPSDLADAPKTIYLFDLPSSSLAYEDRRESTQSMARAINTRERDWNVVAPSYALANSAAEVEAMFRAAVDRGYEGLMIKRLGHLYQRKRSSDWLKLKPCADADGKIIQLIEAVSEEGKPLGRVGSVRVLVDEDNSEAVPHGIEWGLGKDMFEHPDKYIGRWVSFKYMERDRQGGYRHPVSPRLREDKE